MILILFAVGAFLAILEAQNCTWSEWSEWTDCSDNCGNCGNQTRARNCSDPFCSCSGNSTDIQTCADDVCVFPRPTCCVGQAASVHGHFKCA